MTFSVSGGGERDTVEVKKKVALPLHLESTAVYGETTRTAAIALGDLSKIRSEDGALDVRVSSSALVGLGAAFDGLDAYPYGCTEQLASRMIPLLSLDHMARAVGVRVPAATDARMEDAIAGLLSHQHEGGGFGYWNDDPEEAWLSAYALLALDAASKKGFFVPHDALDKGVEYLRNALARRKINGEEIADKTEDGDDDQHVAEDAEQKYATAAFIADVLAALGKPDPGYLNQLYDARAHRPLFTQALLLHGMALAGMPKSQTTTLASELTARLRVDADAAYAEENGSLLAPLLDSPSRTTALVLRALLAGSTRRTRWRRASLEGFARRTQDGHVGFDAGELLGSRGARRLPQGARGASARLRRERLPRVRAHR